MAIFKAVAPGSATRRKKNLAGIIAYVLDPKKTERLEICEGINCTVQTCLDDMRKTKKEYGKTEGREYYHFIRSWPPGDINSKNGKEVTPKDVLEETVDFIQNCKIKGKDKNGKEIEWNPFEGFEILVAVHKDKEHLHAHIIVNSVSFVDGNKFRYTTGDLAKIKSYQDQQAIEKGWSAAPKKGYTSKENKRNEVTSNNQKLYQLMKKVDKKKANSWVLKCASSIAENMKIAKSKEDFIGLMEKSGFETEWKESKKNIVFISKEEQNKGNKKCRKRLASLRELFREDIFTEEAIINEIQRNAGRTDGIRLDKRKQSVEAEDFGSSIAARKSKRNKQDTEQGKSGYSGQYSKQNAEYTKQSGERENSGAAELDKQFSEYQQRKRTDELRNEQARQLEERIRKENKRISDKNRKSNKGLSKSEPGHSNGR